MKKPKRNKSVIFMGAFIVIIMVGSIIGFMYGGSENQSLNYNNFKFHSQNNMWVTKINDKKAEFYYFPTDVKYINMTNSIINEISNKKMVYITFDPEEGIKEVDLVRFDLKKQLSDYFGIYAVNGMANNGTRYNLPIVSCMNATTTVPVIYFSKSNITQISLDNDCIIVMAKNNDDFLALKDRLLYGLFGIIS